jgi:hypothetical protein
VIEIATLALVSAMVFNSMCLSVCLRSCNIDDLKEKFSFDECMERSRRIEETTNTIKKDLATDTYLLNQIMERTRCIEATTRQMAAKLR